MEVEIKVPRLGESISEGNLSRWLKKDGALVRADEPVFELETEKATAEVPAPASGKLKITVPEGQTVAVGAVVGYVDDRVTAEVASADNRKRQEPARAPQAEAPAPRPKNEAVPVPAVPQPSATPEGDRLLSPSARRLADEAGVDLRQVAGSGRGGRVIKEDVQNYVDQHQSQAPPAAPAPPPGREAAAPVPPVSAREAGAPRPPAAGRETRERMSAVRLRIAERLVAAQKTAAILTTFNEADLSAVMALRSQYKDVFQQKHKVGLGFMSFFVKAVVEALRAFPRVNARIDGGDIVYHNYYHIAIAVSTDKGLMVPVIRDADRLNFAQIEQTIAGLAVKARDGKLTVDDLLGGTFTITNGGIFGSLLSTPILNPPQSGILGMHTIQKRPVAVNDQVVIRPMMYLALSYDHRLVDGREAVQFLVRVKECVERPERLLLEV